MASLSALWIGTGKKRPNHDFEISDSLTHSLTDPLTDRGNCYEIASHLKTT